MKRAKPVGEPPLTDSKNLRCIEKGLTRGPEGLGFDNGPWTTGPVAELMEIECGVRYLPPRLAHSAAHGVDLPAAHEESLRAK